MNNRERLIYAVIRSSQTDLEHAADSLERAGLKDLARSARQLRARVIKSGGEKNAPCVYCQGTGIDPDNLGKKPLNVRHVREKGVVTPKLFRYSKAIG